MDKKKYGEEGYGAYGFGYCNPAFSNQEPVSNEVYLATIPEDDPWFTPLSAGFKALDEAYPGWKVGQIKTKFNECRFYADAPAGLNEIQKGAFYAALSQIEKACDQADRERARTV